ncbi:MAG: response regulator transcription factor [Pyrinomonadaceae bacterium]
MNNLSPTKKRILCVEDNVDTCELLAVLLRDFEFEYTDSVSSAFEAIARVRHDLYILDNWLPDGSGLEVCREIRRLYDDVPIIFASAAAQRYEIEEGLAAGANEYLLKPFDPEVLRRVVKDLIGM